MCNRMLDIFSEGFLLASFPRDDDALCFSARAVVIPTKKQMGAVTSGLNWIFGMRACAETKPAGILSMRQVARVCN